MTPPNTSEAPFAVRALAPDEVRRLYAERLERDFPPDELKPLARIERALARGEYACYGATAGDDVLAYAFFVTLGRRALFDYYAVEASLRGQGIGSRFIRALIEGPLSGMTCALLEVDEPDAAANPAEAKLRRRRLAFYLRNGLVDTGEKARVFGVDYRILALPVGKCPGPDAVRRVYAALYRAMLPPALYAREVEIPAKGGQEP